MPAHHNIASSVVVGVDGSRPAIEAALWAVDEAVSRDIPLRLVYAIDNGGGRNADAHAMARQFAAAESAVRCAAAAVESTDKPVKIEAEILQERPVTALRKESINAAMLCVGSIGVKHFQDGRIGSTAATVASVALCPVAVVRGHDPMKANKRLVVAEVDGTPAANGVLRCGFDEARLRGTQLRVLTTWKSRSTDILDNNAVTGGNRRARDALERRLEQWRKRYPDVDVTAAAVHRSPLSHLAERGDSIQLLVVAHDRGHGIRELLGPPGNAALNHANCSALICEPQTVL